MSRRNTERCRWRDAAPPFYVFATTYRDHSRKERGRKHNQNGRDGKDDSDTNRRCVQHTFHIQFQRCHPNFHVRGPLPHQHVNQTSQNYLAIYVGQGRQKDQPYDAAGQEPPKLPSAARAAGASRHCSPQTRRARVQPPIFFASLSHNVHLTVALNFHRLLPNYPPLQ
jgi:hypothetical protein